MHNDTIESVKDTMQIAAVVEHFGGITLKKKGSVLQGCCPVHNEKSPSFTIYENTNTYKCFGCGIQGNAITFVMLQQKIDFLEAVRLLAAFYNIEIKEWSYSAEDKQKIERKEQLRIWTKSLQNMLVEDQTGMNYFLHRGLKLETLEAYGVGYVGAKTILNFGIENLDKQAIGITNEQNNSVLWDRVTIPICDEKGNIEAFGGRIHRDKQDGAKWINTRNSELFVKGSSFFGLQNAYQAAKKENVLYITEGYPDVMAMYEIGKPNTVAVCGTALTELHIEKLAKLFKAQKMTYVLIFNNDSKKRDLQDGRDAGKEAAIRAIPMLLPIGEVKIVRLESGNDIQEIYKAKGISAILTEVSSTIDSISYVISDVWGDEEKAKSYSANIKVEKHKKISDYIAKVKDEDVRDIYINDCCSHIGISPKRLSEYVMKVKSKSDSQFSKNKLKTNGHIKVLDSFFELQPDYDFVSKTSSPIYIRRAVGELEREFSKPYVKSIPKYLNWITEPSHVAYRQEVDLKMSGETYSFFNEYKPLPITAKPFALPEGWQNADFDYEKIPQLKNTARFYKHIYNYQKYGSKYVQLGWDYFAIMYLHPERNLQARCFVSTEEGTGKSTIYNYEQAFYGHNATKTTAKRLITNFNADLASKILIAIEETKDDKGTIENDLKDLITGSEKIVEGKFENARKVRSFEKYLFLSNHPDSFMKVGSQTTRFAVIDVPTIKERDNNLLEKMVLEIPYVMYFLEQRGIFTPDTDRLWFEPTLWENEALLNLRQASKDLIIQNLENLIMDLFIKTTWKEAVIKLSSNIVQKYMTMYAGKSYEQRQPTFFAQKCKNEMGLVVRESPSSFEYPKMNFFDNTASWVYEPVKDKARFIEFPVWRFVTADTAVENFEQAQLESIITDVQKDFFHILEAEAWKVEVVRLIGLKPVNPNELISDPNNLDKLPF